MDSVKPPMEIQKNNRGYRKIISTIRKRQELLAILETKGNLNLYREQMKNIVKTML